MPKMRSTLGKYSCSTISGALKMKCSLRAVREAIKEKSYCGYIGFATKDRAVIDVKDVLEILGLQEKELRELASPSKIYDWLEANVPKWSEKGCHYLDTLKLFIEKKVLGVVE